MPVKMIKLGMRDCILSKDHCIPVDVIARTEFFDLELENDPHFNIEQGAKIYTATVPEGIHLGYEEGKQLKKLLNLL